MIEVFDRITSIIEENEYYYIYDFSYDMVCSKLTMSFCENPDDIQIELKITFLEVEEFSNKKHHDPGNVCLAEMHNYNFEEKDGKVLVVINTGSSNLHFYTLKKPILETITNSYL